MPPPHAVRHRQLGHAPVPLQKADDLVNCRHFGSGLLRSSRGVAASCFGMVRLVPVLFIWLKLLLLGTIGGRCFQHRPPPSCCGVIATGLSYTLMGEIVTGLTISVVQVKMARTALRLGVRDLAELAALSSNTIGRFERGEALKPATVFAIQAALERVGVEFIAENGGGAGVRLKKESTDGSRPPPTDRIRVEGGRIGTAGKKPRDT